MLQHPRGQADPLNDHNSERSTLNDATSTIEHHGSIDPLQLAYAGYLARFHGNTLRGYEYHLKYFITWCFQQRDETGQPLHPLYTVKRAHIEFYVRHLMTKGWRGSTVNTAMTPIKGFYEMAVWDEYIDRDPARLVALPKSEYRKPQPVSMRDLTLFFDAARSSSPRHHALVTLLYLMGMRIGEAASLRLEGYEGMDTGAPAITYIQKGGATQRTPIPLPVFVVLEEVRAGRTEGPIIPARNGNQLTRSGAAGLVETVNNRAAKLGCKRHINPHLLRKMAITNVLESNMSIRDAQAFARHADPRTTSTRYDLGSTNDHRHPVHRAAALLAS